MCVLFWKRRQVQDEAMYYHYALHFLTASSSISLSVCHVHILLYAVIRSAKIPLQN